MRKTGRIAVATFKKKCLELLDEVALTGRELIVTKRGRPIAKIMPVTMPASLLGSVLREGDLLSPIEDDWDAER